jgi:shikimate dehydrogenase
VVAALGRLGVAQLTICARDTTRVSALVPIGKAFGIACRAAAWTVAPDMVQAASLLVSTVPAAAVASLLPAVQRWPAVFDLIYEGWPTPLGAAAAAFGAPVVGGLPMLVAQAAAAIQLMTGLLPPLDVLRAAGERALAER